MKYIFLNLLIIIFLFSSCSKEAEVDDTSNRFPVLTYDSEISETLTLNKNNIYIESQKDVNYWFQYNLNPKNDLGHLNTKSLFEKKIKIISGKLGASNIIQPIYFNEVICHLLNTGYLECINYRNKEKVFSMDIKPKGVKKYEVIRGGIAYFEDKIVLVDAYGQIKLISFTNNEEIWSKEIDFPILSPPLIYRDYIYFISADNRIFAVSINNGEVLWTFQTITESKKNFYSSSPAAFENIIIAPFSNGEIVAFNYENGRPLWSENVSKISLISNFDIKDISASPVVSGDAVYTLSTKGKLISINIINGKRNWSIDLSGYRTPIISGNQIYVVNEDGKLLCIEKSNGEIYWITELEKYRKNKNAENLNLWLGPYLVNENLYNISTFGEVKIVSPITGELLSQNKLGIKDIVVPPIIVNDAIFLADERSNVYQIK